MVPEVLHGLLWVVRAGVRTEGVALQATHGFADPDYRPPRLPCASVLGPLDVSVEPERELGSAQDLMVLLPGGWLGSEIEGSVARDDTLELEQDDEVKATILAPSAKDGTSASQARKLATELERAARNATWTDLDGGPLSAARQAAARKLTIRYEGRARRIVISSGQRGRDLDLDRVRSMRSSVRVVGGSAREALGLDQGSSFTARLVRETPPAAQAFFVDCRVDLWAPTQLSMAALADAWLRRLPTRAMLITRPALLAADAEDGAQAIRLLSVGEPVQRQALLHWELSDGLKPRRGAGPLILQSGAVLEATGLALGQGTGSPAPFLALPVVPDPRQEEGRFERGFWVSAGVQLDASGAAGESGTLLSVRSGVEQLRVSLERFDDKGSPFVRVLVEAPSPSGPSKTSGVLPIDPFLAGVQVHVILDAGTRHLTLFLDGALGLEPDPSLHPSLAVPGPVSFVQDGRILLGPSEDLDLRVTSLQLLDGRVGPSDPGLRRMITPASRWRRGDRIQLSQLGPGGSATAPHDHAIVLGSDGDSVLLDRPLSHDWTRGETVVHAQDFFVHQKQFRRRDDFKNRLYRFSVNLRVSAYLDELDAKASGALVLTPELEIDARAPNPS